MRDTMDRQRPSGHDRDRSRAAKVICNEEKDLWHLVQHATMITIAARDDLSSFGK